MKKILLISFLMMALSLAVCAQDKANAFARTGKNSFRAGAAYWLVSMPELKGNLLLYHQYTRNLYRWLSLAATISTAHGSNSGNIISMEGFIIGDLSIHLNLLERRRHTLKAGAGLSLLRFSELEYRLAPFLNADNQLQHHYYNRKWTNGHHFLLEYEFNVYKSLFLGARVISYTYNDGYGAYGLGVNGGIRF